MDQTQMYRSLDRLRNRMWLLPWIRSNSHELTELQKVCHIFVPAFIPLFFTRQNKWKKWLQVVNLKAMTLTHKFQTRFLARKRFNTEINGHFWPFHSDPAWQSAWKLWGGGSASAKSIAAARHCDGWWNSSLWKWCSQNAQAPQPFYELHRSLPLQRCFPDNFDDSSLWCTNSNQRQFFRNNLAGQSILMSRKGFWHVGTNYTRHDQRTQVKWRKNVLEIIRKKVWTCEIKLLLGHKHVTHSLYSKPTRLMMSRFISV